MEINCMDDIPWSLDKRQSFIEYLTLCLELIKKANIIFSEEEISPITTIEKHLSGEISDIERRRIGMRYSEIVHEEERLSGIRNIDSDRALKARLAFSLLGASCDKDSYGESLEWVLLYIWKLGVPGEESWRVVQKFFQDKPSSN